MSLASKQYSPEEEAEMRARGLRPVTIWVPDTTRPGFAEEFRRQAELSAQLEDRELDSFLEAAWQEIDAEATENET
jgi:hypothetical protein